MNRTIISAILGCCLAELACADPGVWTVWVPVSLEGIDSYQCPIGDDDEMNATIDQRLYYATCGIQDDVIAGISSSYHLSGTEGREKLDCERNLVLLLKAKVAMSWPGVEGQVMIDLSNTTEKALQQQALTIEQFAKLLVCCTTKTLASNGYLTRSYPIIWKMPKAFLTVKDKLPKAIEPQTKSKAGEQAGTGQPATRPESKSEGGDKSQPEAEGRSR